MKAIGDEIASAMFDLENIDFYNLSAKKGNQKKVNKAYNTLDKILKRLRSDKNGI